MITVGAMSDGLPEIVATIRGLAVYLDNDSLIDIARGDPDRRARFTAAVQQSGSLIFSMANAVDLSGPTLSATIDDIRAFLDGFENAWFPADLDPWAICERELQSNGDSSPLLSPVFTEAFFKQRAYDLSPEGSRVISLAPETFFKVSAVVDWAQQNRDDVRARMDGIDQSLIAHIKELRELCDMEPALLDTEIPAIPFDARRPATFVLHALLRLLVKEAKAYALKKGDGLDLCHAVIGTSYASVTTVDKAWKRRSARRRNPDWTPSGADLLSAGTGPANRRHPARSRTVIRNARSHLAHRLLKVTGPQMRGSDPQVVELTR